MLVLHLGEDTAVKEQSHMYLADISNGKKEDDSNNMTLAHVTF